jgi:hypothetical protein
MNSSILQEPESLITERVCRVTLDCKVRVGDITPELLRKSIYWDDRDQESALEHAERQRLLLYALLRDVKALEQFLTYVVATDFGVLLDTSPEVMFPLEDEDAILARVHPSTGGGEASSVEGDPGSHASFDDTELFHACFEVDWRMTILREVVVMGGDDDPEGMSK